MGRTERLEVRLDDELLKRVDAWVAETDQVSSRSDALRQLVSIGLDVAAGKSVHLTSGEKLNFMLLRDIVKHLDVPTEVGVDFVAEVIYVGHYWAPTWEMQGLFHNYADKPADVSFVVDVLDMWDMIEERVEKLSDGDLNNVKTANGGHAPKFRGFDGNNEAELVGIARFLVNKMDRFSRFKGRDLNSHMPTVAWQRRMLAVFNPTRSTLTRGRGLSAAEIVEILSAASA